MMKIKCLIVDDKPLAIDILTSYIHKVPFLQLLGSTTNPLEALEIVRVQPIDLVFLDIQMPELTGLQFMKITGKQYKVILTTAYAEYALDGFEHDVIDYLLKPVSFERFYRAVDKAQLFFKDTVGATDIKPIQVKSDLLSDYLFIKTESKVLKVNLKDILYIEGLQNYIVIRTLSDKIISLQPLKRIELQLPQHEFVRVHKSYIVALRHIHSIERNRISIADAILPVGDRFKDDFLLKMKIS